MNPKSEALLCKHCGKPIYKGKYTDLWYHTATKRTYRDWNNPENYNKAEPQKPASAPVLCKHCNEEIVAELKEKFGKKLTLVGNAEDIGSFGFF